MSVLPLVFASGWASGINAYAVVLLLGLLGAAGVTDEVPETLQQPEVLIAAGALFMVEAVVDKVPYLDSMWDTVSTFIRPVVGGSVAALLAEQSGSMEELTAGAVGGSTALASHIVKAGTRMAINASPEPFSNVVASIAEDLGVGSVITLAVFHPVAAAIIAGVLLVLGLVLLFFLAHRIRRFRRRRRARRIERERQRAASGPTGGEYGP
ncbi:DUF4126 domain-containing protein [Streptomyces sp. NPDC051940]|uniref:DUF4126 domain-containing protein n=1 Tax=Streptomyces sp. NPDC051940 TaxID=3155675 RepID=UPI00343359EF